MAGQTNSGTIKFVNPDKGYGFIGRDDGQRDVFFQVGDLDRSLNFFASLAGTPVMFDIVETQTGPRGVNITRA